MPTDTLRPAVQAFAHDMERVLSAHDGEKGKAGWLTERADAAAMLRNLLHRLPQETAELNRAVNLVVEIGGWYEDNNLMNWGWSRINPETGKRECASGDTQVIDDDATDLHFQAIIDEAADVANFAMMVADLARSLMSVSSPGGSDVED